MLFLTNQNAYEVHRGSGAGLSSTNFLVWFKWEEVEALAFRVGCVAVVYSCMYVFMKGIVCIFCEVNKGDSRWFF